MALSISNTSKISLSITNVNKESELTWEDADLTWDEQSGIWAAPKRPFTKDSKNSLSISNTSKL